jgi:integrase
LTDSFARTAESGLYWDLHKKAPPGFLLRVTPAGARAWCLNYETIDGVERRMTIGKVATYTVGQARDRAAQLRRIVDEGGDPLNAEQERRAAPTVTALVERYVKEVLWRRRPGTRVNYLSIINGHILPVLKDKKVHQVTKADVEKLYRDIITTIAARRTQVADATPPGVRRANAVVRVIRLLFEHAIEWGWRGENTNPAKRIKFADEHPRSRYLDMAENARLDAVLEDYRAVAPDSVDALNLLRLTGARASEVINATWGQFDLTGGTWVKAAVTVKQKREHRTPTSPEVVAILRRRQAECDENSVVRLRDDRVFPGLAHWKLTHDWFEIRRKAGLDDVRIHDLRHSYAALLASNGASLPIIGAMLGHSSPTVTHRYVGLLDKTLREAAGIVGKIVGGSSQ